MSKTEHPLQALATYLPEGTFLPVATYLQQYKVHLTVARERKSILGDYRNAHNNRNHRISVNGNLNTWSFLVTLLHELAHLLTFEKYGNRVQPHGREWKQLFGQLLAQFIQSKIFPPDIEKELLATLDNPGASSCAEESLMRTLRKYDTKEEGRMLVEEIPANGLFKMKDGRLFKKGEKLRKRYRCQEAGTNKVYLFSPIFEVQFIPGG
jgi:SprT protein